MSIGVANKPQISDTEAYKKYCANNEIVCQGSGTPLERKRIECNSLRGKSKQGFINGIDQLVKLAPICSQATKRAGWLNDQGVHDWANNPWTLKSFQRNIAAVTK